MAGSCAWATATLVAALGLAGTAAPLQLELLGEVRLPTGIEVDGVEVGGLSGLTWDPTRDLYLAVSDDRGVDHPIRLITLRIDLGSGTLEPSGVALVGAVPLRDGGGALLAPFSADLEGIVRTDDGALYISSEGEPSRGAPPYLARISPDGRELHRIPLPLRYLPGEGRGVRSNLSLESLTAIAGGRVLVTASENALEQDGPAAGIDRAGPARILMVEAATGRVVGEHLYPVDTVPVPPQPPDAFATNGLVDLLPLDPGRFLALERWFAMGSGHGGRLFLVDTAGASDLAADRPGIRPVSKALVLDLAELGIPLDNLEGMTWGPRLPDGRRTVILISDNNFKPFLQVTQILALAVGPAPPAAGATTIGALQGRGHVSPALGRWATGIEGVVTAARDPRRGGGVFVQAAAPDGDPATSDGIWVRATPSVELTPGELVRVAGLVREAGRPGELAVTCLDEARIERLGRTALPAAVVVGEAGRIPPGEVVDDDGMAVFEPERDAIDFFESLEGMRVRLDRPRVVGPTSRYGEMWVVGDDGARSGPWTSRGGLLRTAEDRHPEALPVEGPELPAARVGDRADEAVEGVLDFAFGRYRVTVERFPPIVRGGLEPETSTLERRPGHLTVATFNVENLAQGSSRMVKAAEVIARRLSGPEVVALQEIQDDSGSRDDGTVTAAATLEELTAAIAAAGGPSYRWLQLDPRDGAEGGQPGGNIRVALLLDPDRVAIPTRGEGAHDRVVVGPGPSLVVNPVRLEHPAFEGDPEGESSGARRPLVAELEVDGRPLFVVVVHLSSKGSDDRMFGPHQPASPRSEAQRLAQAFAVDVVVRRLLEADPLSRVVVLGDFNEHEERPPMRALEAGGLVNLTWRLPEDERYTYVFQGASQTLDHVLVSPVLARGAEIDVVHVNAEFPGRDRSSDHDPVLARVVLPGSGG